MNRNNLEFSSIVFSLVEKFGRIGLLFISATIIIRSLGPESYGDYIVFFNVVAILGNISQLGLAPILVRDIVKNNEEENILLGSAYFARLVVSAFLFLGVILVSSYQFITGSLAQREYICLILLSTLLIAQPFAITARSAFEARVLNGIYSKASLVGVFVSSILKVLAALFGVGIAGIAAGQMVEFWLSAALIRKSFKKKIGALNWQFTAKKAKSIAIKGFPYLLAAVATSAAMKIDVLMLRSISGSYEAGIYGAAARISEMYSFFPAILISTFIPHIVKEEGANKNRTISLEVYRCAVFIAICILLLNSTLVVEYLPKIFGSSYVDSKDILKIHGFMIIPLFILIVRDQIMAVKDQPALRLSFAIIGLVLNLLGNYLLIPSYEAIGAAYATLISLSISALLVPLIIPKTRHIGLLQIKALFTPSPYGIIKKILH